MSRTVVEGRFFRTLYQLHQSCPSHHQASIRREFTRRCIHSPRHKNTRRNASSSAAAAAASSAAATATATATASSTLETAAAASETKGQQDKMTMYRSPDTANTNVHADLSSHMRHLMRRVPHSVAVVTASAAAAAAAPGQESIPETTFRGMTVSSFNTVALTPTPLVSFNVKLPSATYSALTENGHFLIHLLRSSGAGARIADVFAKGNSVGSGSAFQQLAMSTTKTQHVQIFSGAGTHGAPLLAGPGVMRVLRCRVLPAKEIHVNDHVVLVAEVLGILSSPSVNSRQPSWQENKESAHELGLVYADRAYRKIGQEISPSARLSGDVDLDASQNVRQENIQRTIGLNVRRGDEL